LAGEYESVCLKKAKISLFKNTFNWRVLLSKGGSGVKKKNSKNVDNSL